MVKHYIMWKLKDDIADKKAAAEKIKSGLEGLVGVVPGLLSAKVHINPMDSSNASMMLDTSFENEADYDVYKTHPAHIAVAEYVRSVVCERVCFDLEE